MESTPNKIKYSPKLTKQQRKIAETIFELGYAPYHTFPICAANRPCWRLVKMGLAYMDFGPKGEWLQSYGFMPIWSDPVC